MTENTLYRSKLLQNLREHDVFLKILRDEKVTSYLEIGSMFGGSLWRVAHALPVGSKIVSVDYAIDTPEALPHLKDCIKELARDGYDAHLFVGDSMSGETIEAVSWLAPFDCVFIDGAHTLEAVTSDWKNYGPLGKIVVFHDIAWNDTWRSSVPGRAFKAMGVPELWDKIKVDYHFLEIKLQVPSNYYGLGVLWRD